MALLVEPRFQVGAMAQTYAYSIPEVYAPFWVNDSFPSLRNSLAIIDEVGAPEYSEEVVHSQRILRLQWLDDILEGGRLP